MTKLFNSVSITVSRVARGSVHGPILCLFIPLICRNWIIYKPYDTIQWKSLTWTQKPSVI